LAAAGSLWTVFAEDADGQQSPIAEVDICDNIILGPTLSLNRGEVRRGDTLLLFGYSVPRSMVRITVSEALPVTVVKVRTNDDGFYQYRLDTAFLASGQYQVFVQTFTNDNQLSQKSGPRFFGVGQRSVAISFPRRFPSFVDISQDGRIMLIDLSILAYWYGRPLPERMRQRVDLNDNGRVDLVDLSILAYYLTG
jgi:hypothetical protein